MPNSILLVDDDALLRRSLSYSLERAGYGVRSAGTAEDALTAARLDLPDLVLLEMGLPGMDGLEALRQFRRLGEMPVLFITARRSRTDEIAGLAEGADDYITKPIDTGVLLERIKVALRRAARSAAAPARPACLQVGDLTIDPAAREVTVAGRPVDLPPRLFDLLHALAQKAGQVLPADELLARVWGAEFECQPQVLYVHIRWLRERLEEDPSRPRRVVSLRGAGYKLVSQGN